MTGGTGVVTIRSDGEDGRSKTRLSYRRAGTGGDPVVLLHGGGVDDATLSWKHAIDALADDYRVYAPDWPGYGDSVVTGGNGAPIGEQTIESYVSVLEGFLDETGLADEPVTLVGISMGGAAALGYALEHAETVAKLALVDSYGLGKRIPGGQFFKGTAHVPGANSLGWLATGLSAETARFALDAVVADAGALEPAFVDAFRARASEPGAGTAFEAFQRAEITAEGDARTDFTDDLESLSVPTLLVHGVDDPLFPVRWSKRAHELLPDSRLELLENCGHWVPRERPAEFGECLQDFLENGTTAEKGSDAENGTSA
ncbi:alpha/beta fold hydrolase [Halostagnicola kamekurae]|uniref:Pimeloyl-ACP methyl ester carboxylesterase n=1 Tax=Halostagnicola kamekurae TaxID=619731 RepID=A0A1I6QUU9_9EURY|nr:alpha/beta hydrolase [Halostagnicola kamekurae]SFS56170.1 Pimeloyl-ACP methyl ester carboxylesterase [Halostagnicola kamekurae]